MLYGKEQKGPVSALTQVNGFLVSAIGQKVWYPKRLLNLFCVVHNMQLSNNHPSWMVSVNFS